MEATSISFAFPPVPPVRPAARDSERHIVCHGMLSEYGWIEALQVIEHPYAGEHGCRIYITSEDLRDGETLRPGDIVDFDLFEGDDGRLVAEDCHRRVAIEAAEAAAFPSESYSQALAAWKKVSGATTAKSANTVPVPQPQVLNASALEFVPTGANPWTCAAINAAFLGDSDSDCDEEDVELPPGLEHLRGAAAKTTSPGATVPFAADQFTTAAKSDKNIASSRSNTAAEEFVPSSRFNTNAKEFVPSGSPSPWAVPIMLASLNAAFLADSDSSDSDDEDALRPAPSSSSCPSSPASSEIFVPTCSKEVRDCRGISTESVSTSSGASPRTSDSEAEFGSIQVV
eukprot:gnl/TRDRNA2_/TRDRNA2_182360_c0_seq1.p1 gnl/TRDRNA2_/TRDRNA2_182360_c0~~gnl/TRDRNA2_/TRDRNA2_182360_c0_seq1.p1  ORF type:complete len:343 (-),score=79.20 gnl/TRDRNA2_/TRDRNA2_182360_c0_seq1:70-1098(-)